MKLGAFGIFLLEVCPNLGKYMVAKIGKNDKRGYNYVFLSKWSTLRDLSKPHLNMLLKYVREIT